LQQQILPAIFTVDATCLATSYVHEEELPYQTRSPDVGARQERTTSDVVGIAEGRDKVRFTLKPELCLLKLESFGKIGANQENHVVVG
jgi:hypothetical protein